MPTPYSSIFKIGQNFAEVISDPRNRGRSTLAQLTPEDVTKRQLDVSQIRSVDPTSLSIQQTAFGQPAIQQLGDINEVLLPTTETASLFGLPTTGLVSGGVRQSEELALAEQRSRAFQAGQPPPRQTLGVIQPVPQTLPQATPGALPGAPQGPTTQGRQTGGVQTSEQQKIIKEALSGKPFNKISPAAQQYRSTGKFQTPGTETIGQKAPPQPSPQQASVPGQTQPIQPPPDQFTSQIEGLFQKYGLIPADATANPHTSYTDYYSKVYSDLGLSQVKTQLDDNLKDYNKIRDEMTTKMAEVNESPWLSQGIRDAKVAQIERKYQSRLDVLSQRQNYFQSQFEFGREEARHAADKMLEQSHQGQELNRELVFKLVDLAEKRIEAQNKLGLFKEEAAIRETEAEKLAKFRAGLGISGLSPEAQQLLAQSFLTTGQLPGLGLGAAGARVSILNQAAQIAQLQGLSGIDLAAQQASFGAGKTALNQLVKQKNLILAFETTAKKNLQLAGDLSDKVDRTGVPAINRWLLAGKRSIAGDVNVVKFDAAVRTAINEYARVVSSVTGGGVTSDTARREVENILNTAQTKDQVLGVIQTLIQEMENRRIGYEQQEASIKQGIKSPFGKTTGTEGVSGSTSSGLNYQILP